MMKILIAFGTRPEAIKMAPVLRALTLDGRFDTKLCVTAQHREMLDQVLEVFDIEPDFDLDVMKPGQSLSDMTSSILLGLESVYQEFTPDIVLVHGDTATTFGVSLSAYYHQIQIGHVEAGLRTGNMSSPWPEEGNRKLTGVLANIHFCPTSKAKNNLINENVNPRTIHETGNTVIDALYLAQGIFNSNETIKKSLQSKFNFLDADKKLILVTAHRRESFGDGFERICLSIGNVAIQYPEIQVVFPVHLNPSVQEPVSRLLSDIPNVYLIEPQEYLSFVYLMDKSYLILTDSGGVQEEAPSLGKPVLVMRDTTERPEAVEAGTVKLVGTNVDVIVSSIEELLFNHSSYRKMSLAHNPYGDGKASIRICDILGS